MEARDLFRSSKRFRKVLRLVKQLAPEEIFALKLFLEDDERAEDAERSSKEQELELCDGNDDRKTERNDKEGTD